MSTELRAELDEWIDANWDPELPVREWWQLLASAGPYKSGPTEPYGKGWGRSETRILAAALREKRCYRLAGRSRHDARSAKAILAHGNENSNSPLRALDS